MDLSLSELSEVFTCNVELGELYWKPRDRSQFNNDFVYKMWNLQYADKKAGGKDGKGYLITSIKGVTIRVHRAVWIFAHGSIPSSLYIDHINHIRDDNRIENLRLVTHLQNQKNQSMHSTNTSGVNGVSFDRKRRKWVASLRHLDNTINLGEFESIDEAIEARLAGNKRFNFHHNHGRDRYLDTPYIDPWDRVK
ncbi:HNH endonuclease [Xenorhabdus bovienii]|uniref:HNH endonuclease n=1 Tax=Xenorhabdus bovienii TaxID=40576 RepID=UPI00237C8C0B|nr:HNH endonuclease [Xenorhabdus bovienii]MDE1484279.1 HNH endonuclease [Xenorhabdus bovienii]MDE9463608.1 HNH endonuclease [Xenorhabdus bovienii]MDE9536127.1 HNH endonuclease [Xenorhabdus bovienii]MDE9590294.1 HNH endonuclease [Xenorhabdus bovienii]